jgi:hypothetical protein
MQDVTLKCILGLNAHGSNRLQVESVIHLGAKGEASVELYLYCYRGLHGVVLN